MKLFLMLLFPFSSFACELCFEDMIEKFYELTHEIDAEKDHTQFYYKLGLMNGVLQSANIYAERHPKPEFDEYEFSENDYKIQQQNIAQDGLNNY